MKDLAQVLAGSLEKNVEDLVVMEDINEAMIIHNLRKRFKNDQIYVHTYTHAQEGRAANCRIGVAKSIRRI